MTLAYNYDPITKEFTFSEEIQMYKHSREGIMEIMSNNATKAQPKKCKSSECNIWNTLRGRWDVITDMKGLCYLKETITDGLTQKVQEIYNTNPKRLPPESTKVKPESNIKSPLFVENLNKWIEDPEFLEDNIKEEIRKDFHELLSKGKEVRGTSSNFDGTRMDSTLESVMKLKSGVDLAELLNQSEVKIRTYDNRTKVVTIGVARKIVKTLGSYVQLRLSDKWDKEDEV